MKKDVIERRPGVSLFILGIGIVLYAFFCQPAIRRRGFPEIDPFWLAMPLLWVAPIILSALFDGKTKLRRWSVVIYAFLSSFFLSGTGVLGMIVPHHVTFYDMLLGMIFFGPVNLLIGFGVEWAAQAIFSRIRSFEDLPETVSSAFSTRVFLVSVLIVAVSVVFPFSFRQINFVCARHRAIADAERDWTAGKAIWYMSRNEPSLFGAEGNTYSVNNGLKTMVWYGGITDSVYQRAYRTVIETKLAKYGPTEMVKQLFTRKELTDLLDSGRVGRVESFPLKRGIAEISANGNYRSGGLSGRRGEPSKYVYAVTVSEKNNALVVVTDADILVFDSAGNILQHVSYWADQALFSNPPTLNSNHYGNAVQNKRE